MGVLISVLIAAAVALFLPEAVLQLQPLLAPAFALTMILVGSLVRSEHRESFRQAPLRPILGLMCQYTVMPLTAWLISQAFEEPSLRIGIVLVGCMPGAIASNVMTLLFKGDLILSITLTTLATLTCPVILAFWLPLLAGTHLEVPAVSLAWSAVWMVVLPAASGILLRKFLPKFPPWWDRMATLVASMAIVLIIMVVVAANRERLAEDRPLPDDGPGDAEPERLWRGLSGGQAAGVALGSAQDPGDRGGYAKCRVGFGPGHGSPGPCSRRSQCVLYGPLCVDRRHGPAAAAAVGRGRCESLTNPHGICRVKLPTEECVRNRYRLAQGLAGEAHSLKPRSKAWRSTNATVSWPGCYC